MITAKDHHNKPLISLTDGKKLGEIKDLCLDEQATQVTAAVMGREGLFNRKANVVLRNAIQVFGIDAWLVKGPDVAIQLPTGSDAPYLFCDELRGREIMTDGGTKVGTVGDIMLDDEARVLGFTLDKVHLQGPIADRKQIARAAVTDLGLKVTSLGASDRPMIVDLSKAETLLATA